MRNTAVSLLVDVVILNTGRADKRSAFRRRELKGPIMFSATISKKGQIVIPAELRSRHRLSPGTQVEFVDEGGVIRLVVCRRVARSEPAAGYGLIKVKPPRAGGKSRRLSEFDPAAILRTGWKPA